MDTEEYTRNVLKLLVVVAILVGTFGEFGGGRTAVLREALEAGTIWYRPNPEYPEYLGRLEARIAGDKLPSALVPLDGAAVCRTAATGPVYARSQNGEIFEVNAMRHCRDERLARVYAGELGDQQAIEETQGQSVWLLRQGFQLVPLHTNDLGREIMSLEAGTFVPWFLAALLAGLVRVVAGIVRWWLLLGAFGVRLGVLWVATSTMLGRFVGIVTPSSIGTDAWRVYDAWRASDRPGACATALVVEKLTGFAALLAACLVFLPFAADALSAALVLPVLGAAALAGLFLTRPESLGWIASRVPVAARPLHAAADALGAFQGRRPALLGALGCAAVAQAATLAMYFCNAMALQMEGVTVAGVLHASAVLALGTFLAPVPAGAGVRELVFVAILGDHGSAVKAFLTAHLALWIEKLPLSLPGGILVLRTPELYDRVLHGGR